MTKLFRAYAWGRIAFGAAGLAAPAPVAAAMMGPEGRGVGARTLMGNFATRDVILGAGLLHALATSKPPLPWVVAGFAGDVLDTLVQVREWDELPKDRRVAGVLFSGGAAVGGAGLLALARG